MKKVNEEKDGTIYLYPAKKQWQWVRLPHTGELARMKMEIVLFRDVNGKYHENIPYVQPKNKQGQSMEWPSIANPTEAELDQIYEKGLPPFWGITKFGLEEFEGVKGGVRGWVIIGPLDSY